MNYTDQEIIEIRQYYKTISPVVLADLLFRSCFFDPLSKDDPESIGKRNMMLEILKIIGSYNDDPMAFCLAIINTLLEQPILRKEFENG